MINILLAHWVNGGSTALIFFELAFAQCGACHWFLVGVSLHSYSYMYPALVLSLTLIPRSSLLSFHRSQARCTMASAMITAPKKQQLSGIDTNPALRLYLTLISLILPLVFLLSTQSKPPSAKIKFKTGIQHTA